MSLREETGYIGSLIFHLTVVGVAVLLASMAPAVREVASEQDPMLLELDPGDGSERDPGIRGEVRGIAEGVSTGDKSKTGLGGKTFAPLKKMDPNKFLKELHENQAKAAEAEKQAKAAAQKDPDGEGPKSRTKKETLEEFIKTSGKTGKGGKSSPTGPAGGTSAVGSAKGKIGIAGSSVGDSGTGRGTGADGFGRAGGKGKNGGDGGSGNAEKLFLGSVRGAFADIYYPLFREQGGEMASSLDTGEIKLTVSESGLVSFAGWVRKPNEAIIARLAEAAVNRMKPVRPPPGGEAVTLILKVGGKLDDA